MIKFPELSDVLNLVGLGADLRAPTLRTLEAVSGNRMASARAEEMAGLIRRRIGRFSGQKTFLTEADRAGIPVAGAATATAERAGEVEGAVPLAAMIETAPDVAEHWRGIGYPEQVIAETLCDLGRQVRKTMAVTGRFGFGQADWIEMIWRGGFAQLGRLQFEITRSTLGAPDAGDGQEGDAEKGPLVLSTHIAPIGSLSPDVVDDSLGRARGFFTGHFPELATEEGTFGRAVCHSWLLDADLMGRMPGSNMDLFARRWTVWDRPVSDGSGIFFGFDRPFSDGERIGEILDNLPYDTRLHRAMIDLWRAGGHVHNCSGWLELP
ncbi:acyltransferase domain-containing protein [Acidipropionibacterium virtanenii]|uniref:Uncharacterized protein n=1 Tax=Acidipropionibacterium virtanenii TaxID=2057246 RepID=A0A344UQ31_9ACTN|nr:acyltransferase domain-containing protein [Acidipropionibacterium virtanenii]AXE37379.1 hypothetical protein JS278_00182 [Acidipropionibacterium virtanenii]